MKAVLYNKKIWIVTVVVVIVVLGLFTRKNHDVFAPTKEYVWNTEIPDRNYKAINVNPNEAKTLRNPFRQAVDKKSARVSTVGTGQSLTLGGIVAQQGEYRAMISWGGKTDFYGLENLVGNYLLRDITMDSVTLQDRNNGQTIILKLKD